MLRRTNWSRWVDLMKRRNPAKWKMPKDDIQSWRIVKGDTVAVIAGKDKGKQGVVKEVERRRNRIVVEGLNFVKKHVVSTEEKRGGIFLHEAPIHYSNLQLVDPSTGKPTRVEMRFLEDGTKVRVAKKSGAVIPKPEYMRRVPRPKFNEQFDTPSDVALKNTRDRVSVEEVSA